MQAMRRLALCPTNNIAIFAESAQLMRLSGSADAIKNSGLDGDLISSSRCRVDPRIALDTMAAVLDNAPSREGRQQQAKAMWNFLLGDSNSSAADARATEAALGNSIFQQPASDSPEDKPVVVSADVPNGIDSSLLPPAGIASGLPVASDAESSGDELKAKSGALSPSGEAVVAEGDMSLLELALERAEVDAVALAMRSSAVESGAVSPQQSHEVRDPPYPRQKRSFFGRISQPLFFLTPLLSRPNTLECIFAIRLA